LTFEIIIFLSKIQKGSEKIYGGEPLPALKEEDVFKHLNLEYRKPEERDF
jgi:hypothetical protein